MVELPLIPDDGTPPYDSLFQTKERSPQPLTTESLSLFLELSLGLTAWKEFEGTRWALRSNPSSGNLHPTEGYVVLPPSASLPDCGGVYHYAPREHALEQRCILNKAEMGTLGAELPAAVFLVGFTSIHWREAWKYGERAFRYCQRDVGHAFGALCFAAAVLDWRVALISALSDTEVAGVLGVDRTTDLIAKIITSPTSAVQSNLTKGLVASVRASLWEGKANRLSPDHVDWVEIAAVENVTVSLIRQRCRCAI